MWRKTCTRHERWATVALAVAAEATKELVLVAQRWRDLLGPPRATIKNVSPKVGSIATEACFLRASRVDFHLFAGRRGLGGGELSKKFD